LRGSHETNPHPHPLRGAVMIELPCSCCGDYPALYGHQHTAYVEKRFNYVTLCDDCWEENNEYWREMWNEYYSMVM
jgi:hypothetical protein